MPTVLPPIIREFPRAIPSSDLNASILPPAASLRRVDQRQRVDLNLCVVRPRFRPLLHARLFAAVIVSATVALAADAAALVSARPLSVELGAPLRQHFSPDDYGGYSSVTAVAHTAEGFTLFGTYHAAILYDGVTYEKIPVPATYVTALCRDNAGVMWAAGDNEIGVIQADAADGQLHYVSRMSWLPADARTFGRMRAMVAGRAGVFAATTDGILHFADGRANFLPLPPESRLQLFSLAGRVYLQDSRRGLLVFAEGSFRVIDTGRTLIGRRIQLVERDAVHALCLIEGEGPFRFELATGLLEKIVTPLAALLAEPMGHGLRMADGRLVFIRGNNRGLLVADPALQSAQVLDAKTGLVNTTIIGAALDADNGLWLGTGNGLVRLDLAPGLTVFDERNAFPIGSASSLVRHAGVLYAASSQGLMRLTPGEPATGQPAHFVPDPRVPEICDNLRDTPEGLLFSTDNAVELLTEAGRRRLFKPPARITMIKPNRRALGLYFIATDDGGVYVMNLAARTTQRVLTLPPGVILWNGAEESDRVSWFGTASSGFWRITATSADWAQATAEPYPLGQSGLPAGKSWTGILSLFDELHFLSETGMYRWHPATQKFSLDERYRIAGVNQLRFMPAIADPTGRAWCSAWTGTLECVRPLGYFQATSPGAFAWHDAPARWQAGVGRFGAGLVLVESEAGRPVLWTKSPTAIARIELDTLPANGANAAWRPVLRRFTMGERSWPVAGGAELRLPFSNLPITLRYAAPRYQTGAPLRYQTRLLGFREEWSAPAVSNETVFTNLTGGPFAFEVRAIDADGIVSDTARLSFSVALPWHRTTGAFVLYTLALAGAVIGFIRWRLSHANRERARLERIVAERTAQLAAARDQAESASRAKSGFLANMSHELRTPLNGVIGYAQVLMKDRDLSPKNRQRVSVVQTSGEHLLRMINEVLDFSKIEAGRLELHSTPFHLPQLLRDVAAALSPRAEQKELEFIFDPAADLPELVVGDALKLRQVLDNLLGNAIKFTAAGHISLSVTQVSTSSVSDSQLSTLSSQPDGECFTFTVQDTGVGISAADLPTLFQPFHQLTDGRPPEAGTGLGLAISHRFVALMGGQLEATSQRGLGSRFAFTIRLPVLALSADAPAAALQIITGYAGPRRRLMIVDDVAVNRHVLRELLEPLGFTIVEADAGEPALASAAATPPDLIFLDLRMPGMNGLELAQRLRALPDGPRLKLIAMSASVLSFNRDDAFAAGCDDFLPKPFREDDLLSRLSLALGLDWQTAAEVSSAPSRPSSRSPFNDPAARLPTEQLHELLAIARRGEIVAFRRRLAELRATAGASEPLIDALDLLAKTYRMERIRERLESALSSPSP
jgi:signal transduction histidine kinase/DNA-binding NarL/FixJ family response regulator